MGVADPEDLDDYREHGGYQSLRLALALGPEGVLREVKESGLKGRGGAAFPMGIKWEAVAKAPVRPHYVVCNADESEPGTFKDRILMEDDPFAVVEAMTIAGFATGSEKGFIYVRGEYPLAAMRLQKAIDIATKRGFLGVDVMGEGFEFGIEIRKGAGAYICGEETALFNSIEGFRGEPRNKPPFPTQEGLFGKPTVVNNVETLVNVLSIVRDGGPAFAAAGTKDSTGSKLFCLSGHVARPGLYEVPFGTTLVELLEKAGGVAGGRELQTLLLGGAAGSFVGPDELEVPLTFEGTRAIGASLGSGVVMVFARPSRHAPPSCTASLNSSETSLAGNASLAVSGPCGSRSPYKGSRETGMVSAKQSSSTSWPESCATRRSAASGRRLSPQSNRHSSAIFFGTETRHHE